MQLVDTHCYDGNQIGKGAEKQCSHEVLEAYLLDEEVPADLAHGTIPLLACATAVAH